MDYIKEIKKNKKYIIGVWVLAIITSCSQNVEVDIKEIYSIYYQDIDSRDKNIHILKYPLCLSDMNIFRNLKIADKLSYTNSLEEITDCESSHLDYQNLHMDNEMLIDTSFTKNKPRDEYLSEESILIFSEPIISNKGNEAIIVEEIQSPFFINRHTFVIKLVLIDSKWQIIDRQGISF